MRDAFSRKEVNDVIERKRNDIFPVVMHKWWGVGLVEKYGKELLDMAEKYPDDIFTSGHLQPGFDKSPLSNPSYRWGFKDDYAKSKRHSIGETIELLDDWKDLDKLLSDFPSAYEAGNFDCVKAGIKKAGERYKLGVWWNLFHERLWTIRGMENLMIDYYTNMDELKIIGRRLNDYYIGILEQYSELGFDGVFVSDDLGHQTGPMMSPKVFHELYYPLYEEFISYAHKKGLHVFLHSCGDNTLLMDDLILSGLNVIHPIQVGCMDYETIAKQFKDKITFLLGFDTQHLLPYGSPNEVEKKLKEMVYTFKDNGCSVLIAAGNGIMPDTPLENIKLTFDIIANIQ